jgi:3-methyladenine DNA glycosylase AlkC
MLVNLQIGFNNNFVTNSLYTKFLGVTVHNTLSWNNHIDLLVKKLSKACYVIRNAKTYMSALIYYAFFSLGYELWNYILGKLVA